MRKKKDKNRKKFFPSISDPHTPVPPRFNERVSPAPIRTGETIVLSCISQGIPPPMYLWFRESVTGTAMIFNSERIYARAGVLVLQSARAEDAGRYVCHANNTAGSEMVELEVSIISSLSIHLVPQQVSFRYFNLRIFAPLHEPSKRTFHFSHFYIISLVFRLFFTLLNSIIRLRVRFKKKNALYYGSKKIRVIT